MTLLFANNAYGTLAGPITNTATSANLAAGTGALFPNPTAPDYFKMTFVDAATGLINEIVHVTARSNDNITIVRAREGTAAQNWLAGDLAQNLWTAGSAQAMLQSVQQAGFYQGTDTATDPNNMTVPTTTAALTAPPAAGQIFFINKGNNPNTGSVKLLVGTGVTADSTSRSVVYGDGTQLAFGDWPGTASAWLYFTGSVYQLLGFVRGIAPSFFLHTGDDTGTSSNTIVATVTPSVGGAYLKGSRYQIKLANALSSGAATANFNGIGTRNVLRSDGQPVQANDLLAGQILDVIDNGTNLLIASLLPSQVLAAASVLTPAFSPNVSAFTPNLVSSDTAFTPGYTTSQTVTFTNATYVQAFGANSLANDNSSLNNLTTRLVLYQGSTLIGYGPYIGCANSSSQQTPLPVRGSWTGLNPALTYTLNLVSQKGQNTGPVRILDARIDAYYGKF